MTVLIVFPAQRSHASEAKARRALAATAMDRAGRVGPGGGRPRTRVEHVVDDEQLVLRVDRLDEAVQTGDLRRGEPRVSARSGRAGGRGWRTWTVRSALPEPMPVYDSVLMALCCDRWPCQRASPSAAAAQRRASPDRRIRERPTHLDAEELLDADADGGAAAPQADEVLREPKRPRKGSALRTERRSTEHGSRRTL